MSRQGSAIEQSRVRRQRGVSSDSESGVRVSSTPKNIIVIEPTDMRYSGGGNMSLLSEEGEVMSRTGVMRVRNGLEIGEGAWKLAPFTGQQDASDFFKKYEVHAFARELTTEQMARQLPMYLVGTAMT